MAAQEPAPDQMLLISNSRWLGQTMSTDLDQ